MDHVFTTLMCIFSYLNLCTWSNISIPSLRTNFWEPAVSWLTLEATVLDLFSNLSPKHWEQSPHESCLSSTGEQYSGGTRLKPTLTRQSDRVILCAHVPPTELVHLGELSGPPGGHCFLMQWWEAQVFCGEGDIWKGHSKFYSPPGSGNLMGLL